ncbi:PEP-CTERM sorting domain-containing protein [Colwellia sp. BRX10-6]|nr:PEP-CTERM sorting domain-containing protein [Colwellia sp. BRX10-9]MBA6394385.1 PEP-CTERM sorting domain-containing protein [Colwellia sp. BRX10-6]
MYANFGLGNIIVTSTDFNYHGGNLPFITDELAYVTSPRTAEVPEPSTLAIFALGMIGLASRRFKK